MSTPTTDERIAVNGPSAATVAISILALLVGLFATGRALSVDSTTVPVVEGATADGAAPTTVDAALDEFTIDAPDRLVAGSTVRFTNAGSAPHNVAVRDAGLATPELQPGETAELDTSALAPGVYEWFCEVPGHEGAGMAGEFEVVAAGTAQAASQMAGMDHGGGYMTKEEADAMEANMMASLAAFPAETAGRGAQLMEPTSVEADGTKIFELVVDEVDWEVAPGEVVKAMAYNGQIPGPTIKVDLGDRYVVRVTNMLDNESTTLHPHGVNGHLIQYDGVAPLTQEPIRNGETFDHVFEATEPSLGMYHSHQHALHQAPDGLAGAIIVGDYAELTGQEGVTQEHVMVLNDAGVIGFSLNGKSFPATDPYVAQQGERLMVHYMNEGVMAHPMHLHGQTGWVVAKDGFPLPAPYRADTINVAPGERYTVVYDAEMPGTWVWHCHILSHVKKSDGAMFGMLTALIVEEADTGSTAGGDF